MDKGEVTIGEDGFWYDQIFCSSHSQLHSYSSLSQETINLPFCLSRLKLQASDLRIKESKLVE